MYKQVMVNRRIIVLVAVLLTAGMSGCDQPQNNSSTAAKNNVPKKATLEKETPAIMETTGATNTENSYDLAKLAKVSSEFGASEAQAKLEYQEQIRATLAAPLPVMLLKDLDDPKAQTAQRVLLADERLKQALFHPETRQPLRNEVMSVKPALPSDRVGEAASCQLDQCYRVDIYNFFFNVTITGIVDLQNMNVVLINSLPETQPELSARLKQLAIAIAKHEPAVQLEVDRYLTFVGAERTPDDILPVMAGTKSALKDSLCERSKHLCVAPTYVLGNKALWVIVDLTDLKVAGLRWTTLGKDTGPPTIITERKIENEYVFKNFCEQKTELNRSGWSFNYLITASDGLRIGDAVFNGKPIFESAKVVDWHVSYSRKDTFGYSDATGCPMFSSAVVVAFDGPQVEPIVEDGKEVGFSVTQDFRQLPWPAACNYRYEERYEFYNDGRYRVALSNHGRGCGDDGTYRPVLRLDLGEQSRSANLQKWTGEDWKTVSKEEWSKQPEPSALWQGSYSHKIVGDDGQSYLMAPSTGNFGDGGRGDNAFIYATAKHADRDEGAGDLVTLGACCNTDYQQGPEQFLTPAESLEKQPLVLWYVPQIENDGRKGQEYCWAENQVVDGALRTKTWPCTAGPMFVPMKR